MKGELQNERVGTNMVLFIGDPVKLPIIGRFFLMDKLGSQCKKPYSFDLSTYKKEGSQSCQQLPLKQPLKQPDQQQDFQLIITRSMLKLKKPASLYVPNPQEQHKLNCDKNCSIVEVVFLIDATGSMF